MHHQFMNTLFVLLLSFPLIGTAEEKKEIVSLDEANTVEEIVNYVRQARNKRYYENNKTAEDYLKYLRVSGEEFIAGSEKIFKIADGKSEQGKGFQLKIDGLKSLIQADDNSRPQGESGLSEYRKTLDQLLDELEKEGQFNQIVNNERYGLFYQKVSNELPENTAPEKIAEFTEGAKKWSITKPAGFKPIRPLLDLLEITAFPTESNKNPQLTQKILKEFIDFVNSEDFTLPEDEKKAVAEQLIGYGSRLVGTDPEIYGKTIDNKDFDWASLRGKYVLVKFTASWCGPCKGEIPGMKEAYEKYHDKGFEIVSIYVWDKVDASKKVIEEEKLPWLCISEELTEKAGLLPQGKKYAVTGVPTMFLVDKNGKVILTSARGNVLQKRLAEIFP